MSSYWVKLPADLRDAALAEAHRRNEWNLSHGVKHANRFDAPNEGMELHEIGACGERAFALLTGLTINPYIEPNAAADVGPYFVKSTLPPAGYSRGEHLILKNGDKTPDDAPLVLAVTRDTWLWEFPGWTTKREVTSNSDRWCKYRPERPAWWMHRMYLHPLETLPGWEALTVGPHLRCDHPWREHADAQGTYNGICKLVSGA